MEQKQDNQIATGVRLPQDLREWLREQAENNSRSLSQEIVYRLKQSRAQQVQPTT